MPNALIAGAGIGGLTAALCLARAGFAVTILERAEQLDAAGAGVQVSPNASAVLRDLDVLPRLDGLALAPEAIRIRSARSGATLAAMPLSGAERRWGAPYLVVHRGDLQRALLDAVAAEPRITLSTGTAVLGFGTHADGVAVAAKQGLITLRHMGDLLIGADGLHSFVRKRLTAASADAPRQSRRVAWRALVPAEAVAAALQQPETALWLGTRAHLVHYPLRGGTVVNVVAIVEDAARRTEAEDFWSQPGDAAALIPQFRAWHRDARDLLAAAPFWRKWPLADRAPLPGWTAGRVALLGDAAHPMLPFLAQGAAQAIEDASALGQALAQNESIEAALRAYDAKRRARATRVQAASRQLGDVYHLGGPAALARDLVMRALGPTRMLARYDWLYGAG